MIHFSFVEFETAADLKTAVEKLDNQDFKGANVRCTADVCKPIDTMQFSLMIFQQQDEAPRDRYRSRSPPPRRGGGYGAPADDYYNRRGPPARGYSPRRGEEYRHRSPAPRREEYYGGRERYRSPPRGVRGPPIDDGYPPARSGYRGDDPYVAPPPRRGYDEPYATGYDRPPRARTPPRAYGGGYDERPRYW